MLLENISIWKCSNIYRYAVQVEWYLQLTIKTSNTVKIIDLNKDLEFDVSKGEQYLFSNGFSNYILNFKDNQESISLIFSIDG